MVSSSRKIFPNLTVPSVEEILQLRIPLTNLQKGVSLGGCFIAVEDRDRGERHERGEEHERGGGHEERH